MIILRQHRIYRQDLKANPRVLYIFGDNLDRAGLGGQAKEMRGEKNAFGIATKRSISHNYPQDYFFDHQLDIFDIIDNEFLKLVRELHIGKWQAMVLPSDGIGTGLARLSENAPSLLRYINIWLKQLESVNK